MSTNPNPSLDALLRGAATRIDATDARWLLAHAVERPQGWLYAHGRDPAPHGVAERFDTLVARRAAGEPVAYITGVQGFWGCEFAVTPATLIPRPETERLVELALAHLPARGGRLADLGTGSGAIALAVARACTLRDSVAERLLHALVAQTDVVYAATHTPAFRRPCVALLVLSIVPDLTFGFDAASAAVLILTHVVAAAIVVPVLARRLADN